MAFITKSQVKRAIALGTLNPRIIDKFFHDIKLRAYDYDYLIQDQLIDIYTMKANFKNDVFNHTDTIKGGIEDGKIDKVSILQLDKSIVQVGKRKAFRHYSFYNKPLDQEEMMKRRDIFKYGILTFINGVLDLDYRIQPRDDKTFLLFPYKRFDGSIRDTDIISTVMIPEAFIAKSRQLISTDLDVAKRISINVFENSDKRYFKECKGFAAFFVKSGYKPVFITGITYDDVRKALKFTDLPAAIGGYTMLLLGLEQYDSIINCSSTDKYFYIPKHNMPIPASNLLVMVQDSNGYSYHINAENEIGISECYPNVYKIDNYVRRPFKVIVLYSNRESNDMIDYDTEMDYYLDIISLIDRYRANNVPDILREYKPIPWDYLIQDYMDTIGIPTPTSDPWYPFLYKLNKIKDIYKLWCLFFQTYVRRTYGFLENWLLDVKNIDLPSHIRESTLPEIPLSSKNYRPFPEPMCLFRYKNTSDYDNNAPYSWFIDGKFMVPFYTATEKGYSYAYFKASSITPNTLIEVERFDNNCFSKIVHVDDYYEGKVNWLKQPTVMNSIFITDSDGNFINNRDLKIYVKDTKNFGETWFEMDMDLSVFILENGMTIRIVPNISAYKNINIRINCNNKAVVWEYYTKDMPNFMDINYNSNGNVQQCKKDIRYRLRMYDSEGRMYPRYGYEIENRNNYNDLPNIALHVDTLKGDPFKIQYMGYDEREILHMDNIPQNGLISLEGKLDKPFSLTYHTVFLNGYKLNERHIKQISPFTIAIQNVTFSKDLYIYERVHGEELYAFLEDESSLYLADRLLEEDSDYYQKVLEGLNDIVIDPTIPDMDDEIEMMIAFIRQELAIKFINMDDIHNPAEYDQYEEIFTYGWRLFMNADDRVRNNIPLFKWFYMNHDMNILYNGE